MKTQNKTKCKAKLKSGGNCLYYGKDEFGGYCGHHKHLSPDATAKREKRRLSNEERNRRLAELIAAGSGLIFIMEKALELVSVQVGGDEHHIKKHHARLSKIIPTEVREYFRGTSDQISEALIPKSNTIENSIGDASRDKTFVEALNGFFKDFADDANLLTEHELAEINKWFPGV